MTGGMMFKGTPGEWYTDAEFIRSSDGPDTYIVAEILSGKGADRSVIAAAPELLEALMDARYALYGNGPGNPKIDAAIAKALGEQK